MAAQDDLLVGFLGESGASASDLAQLARQPEFLAAVLDFVFGADDRVLAVCAGLSVTPAALAEARASLPGGAVPDWT